MVPATYNPAFYQGDTWELQFTITRTVNAVTTPWDLTNFTVKSQLRKLASSATVTLEFTCIKIDATNGVCKISATPTQTKDIKAGNYVWDLQLKDDTTDDVTTILAGRVTVTSEVTRETV